MSHAGVYAQVIERGIAVKTCLLVGAGIPRIHHGDGVPVYLVTEHKRGSPIADFAHKVRTLVAYPVAWPGPGGRMPDRWVYAKHESMRFDAPVPLFDLE